MFWISMNMKYPQSFLKCKKLPYFSRILKMCMMPNFENPGTKDKGILKYSSSLTLNMILASVMERKA